MGNDGTYEDGKQAQLFFVYSIVPHRIVMAVPTRRNGEQQGMTVSLTQVSEYNWGYGELRGGSPAQLVGNKYLAFFHSSGRFQSKYIISYYMGAYLFEARPPFRITHISYEPIVAKTFINESLGGWASRWRDYVIFPMGFVFNDAHIWVSYGRNDREGWIVKLNRTGLIASLQPVNSIVLGQSEWEDESSRGSEAGQLVPHSFKYE